MEPGDRPADLSISRSAHPQAWLLHVCAPALLGALLWLAYGGGYVSLDGMWSLVWGRDLVHGAALSHSGTTTPHLLSNLLGAALTPLGSGADRGLIAVEFYATGGLVWIAALLAREVVGPRAPVAVAAALLVAFREQLLFASTSVFLDVLVTALVAWAALMIVRYRRDRVRLSMTLLLLAGLLRPEPWLIAGVFWLWRVTAERRAHLGHLLVVVAAPALWFLSDLVLNGSALFSVRETPRINDRLRVAKHLSNGISDRVIAGPKNIAHAMGPEIFVLALVAAAFLVWPLVRRLPLLRLVALGERELSALRILLAGAVVYGAAIIAEALIGTLIFSRFGLPLMVVGVVMVVVVLDAGCRGLAAVWTGGPPARLLFGAAVFALVVIQLPFLISARKTTGQEHDRYSAARAAIIHGVPCLPIATPNANLRAYVAEWAGVRGDQVIDAATRRISKTGSFITADSAAAQRFLFDPAFPNFRGRPPGNTAAFSHGWVIISGCRR